MSQQPSGIDLARAALAAARADAKTRPVQPQKKTRTTRRASSRRPGDPVGLGAAIDRMMAERGWEPPEAGGSILDQWPTIAPELEGKVAAVRFEHDTGILHLKPVSDAYATQLRMFRTPLVRRIHEKTGSTAVRGLKILAPGSTSAPCEPTEPIPAPAAEAPVRTRETASPGYRAALEAALTHRPEQQSTNPYVTEAIARQEAALRANRQPEEEHREAMRADGLNEPTPGSMEASEAAAIAYKRQAQARSDVPRRLFGAA